MATITGKLADINHGVVLASWDNMAAGDIGTPAEMVTFGDKTAQAVGDATGVAIQGSNDGTNWFPLTDAAGTTIALAGATNAMALVRENPRYVRPVATGGTSTDVTIVAVASNG